MCSMAMVMHDVTMATTRLMGSAACEVCWPREEEARKEFRAPRMSWVVVTDENVTDKNQNRRMQMRWAIRVGRPSGT